MKCRSEASVISNPVSGRADGVEDALQGPGIQGTRNAESCIGFAGKRIPMCVFLSRNHEGPRRRHCLRQITPRPKLPVTRICEIVFSSDAWAGGVRNGMTVGDAWRRSDWDGSRD